MKLINFDIIEKQKRKNVNNMQDKIINKLIYSEKNEIDYDEITTMNIGILAIYIYKIFE